MLRYQTNKQALIIAVLVVLLCFVCLTGATLALFTYSGQDGAIGIVVTAGNVEIDIVDTAHNTLKGSSLAFVTSAERPEALFAPGVGFYTQAFLVENTGDIPVSFTLSISRSAQIDAVEFNAAFEVYVVKEKELGLDNAEKITDFRGRLAAGEATEAYCLVVKMKETAINAYQGVAYPGIGITVHAVQGNATVAQ